LGFDHQLAGAFGFLGFDADRTRPLPALPAEIRARLTPGQALAVINKIDLVSAGAGPPAPAALPVVRVSALTGDGWAEFEAAVVRHAESFRAEQGEDLIAINARHALALGQATRHLETAREKVESNAPIELLASDLRAALVAFGEIAGRIDNEQVLDRLFATFCIGK
jgi:tRNA modification GTPase